MDEINYEGLNLQPEQVETVKKFFDDSIAKVKEGLLTKEDFEKNLQSETDKIRTKYSQEKKLLEDELATLRPVTKTEAELALEQKHAEMDAREKELAKRERSQKVKDVLSANKMPFELADYLSGEDIESVVSDVAKIINKHLLDSNFKPNPAINKPEGNVTKEQFKKMGLLERNKLYESNKELYKMLNKK